MLNGSAAICNYLHPSAGKKLLHGKILPFAILRLAIRSASAFLDGSSG